MEKRCGGGFDYLQMGEVKVKYEKQIKTESEMTEEHAKRCDESQHVIRRQGQR